MDNNNRLNGLKEEYNDVQMSSDAVKEMRRRMESAKQEKRFVEKKGIHKPTLVAAALIMALLILPNTTAGVASAMEDIPVLGGFFKVVTIRDYDYNDKGRSAEVEASGIETGHSDSSEAETGTLSAEEINKEIEALTDRYIKEFEVQKTEEGYQNLKINTEVIQSTGDCFTMKLSCYSGEGDGYQENYYYTIDLNTGERLTLKELLNGNEGYKQAISEDIKAQMRLQMTMDKNVSYWVDDAEMGDENFDSIDDNTKFYINDKGELVIVFDEGEVAPSSMGVVEFAIPSKVIHVR